MKRLAIAMALLAAPPAFAATGCEDIWFTRNLLMDRAGYCFGSPLGQALFDNSNCIGQNVQPPASAQPLIQKIQQLEQTHQCQVNTNQTWLDMDDMAFRRAMRDLPLYEDFPGGCISWNGPQTPLHDGYTAPLGVVGNIQTGDNVYYNYEAVDEWVYVSAHNAQTDQFKAAGWMYWPGADPCDQMIP
ncbi:DUF4453 domain-containing protein [Arenibacterium halophilum]|uniref:DUF4453 domain-containing protein n=1 Tax=Arenibacterium halophilum TaxID=2583821 RepID=A0ABY2XB98_9RHOB|nr:DUF4453 domain-containing protein [Arenibacterium halophilum]TMV13652.1 DUF4453 domain-containing protein [Arenibacterium halophilum]